MLIFDIETNGLLNDLTQLHCMSVLDTETRIVRTANHQLGSDAVEYLLKDLESADVICGHNIISFDIPAIQKIYPWFKPKGKVIDTLVMSEVIYADMLDRDYKRNRKLHGQWIEPKWFGSHALEAWGQRLGFPKDDYSTRMKEQGLDPWAEWSQAMEDYCVADVQVSTKLYERLTQHEYSEECLELEHKVKTIVCRQERHGFLFDVEAGGKLYAELVGKRDVLTKKLRKIFKPWYKKEKVVIPKVNNKRWGYAAGAELTKVALNEFNPGSDQQIANRLQEVYGWKPKEFTDKGHPKVSEDVLSNLNYEGIAELIEFMTVNKRIGQLAEGKEAWLKKVGSDGRIHGRVKTNGAVTGRMTHSSPNIAQTPAGYSPYGPECRSLFIVPQGYALVGCDAEGLELRALAHFMALYDGGEYARTVVEGTKQDGTDAHTVNQKAVGLYSRDNAKTWFYAFIYGAGDYKLGTLVYDDMPKDKRPPATDKLFLQLGSKSRKALEGNLPALGKLVKKVKANAKRGYLKGLDGRHIPVRSEHAALNTLLQSAGAVIMKKSLVILDKQLQDVNHYMTGSDYEYVANVHDEFQIEVKESLAERVGGWAAQSISNAGEHYNFRCPLAGDYAVGASWQATH